MGELQHWMLVQVPEMRRHAVVSVLLRWKERGSRLLYSTVLLSLIGALVIYARFRS